MTLHRKRSSTTTTRPLQQPRKVHFQGRRVGTMVYLHYDSTRVEKGLQLLLQTHSLAREARSITWAYNTPFWMMVLERERSRNSSNPDIMMGTRGPFGKSRNRHPRTTYYSAEFHLSWIQFTLLYTAAENPVEMCDWAKNFAMLCFFLCVYTKQSRAQCLKIH